MGKCCMDSIWRSCCPCPCCHCSFTGALTRMRSTKRHPCTMWKVSPKQKRGWKADSCYYCCNCFPMYLYEFMIFCMISAKQIHIFLQQTPWEKKIRPDRSNETFGNHPQPPRELSQRNRVKKRFPMGFQPTKVTAYPLVFLSLRKQAGKSNNSSFLSWKKVSNGKKGPNGCLGYNYRGL